jgi:hypothetical protein
MWARRTLSVLFLALVARAAAAAGLPDPSPPPASAPKSIRVPPPLPGHAQELAKPSAAPAPAPNGVAEEDDDTSEIPMETFVGPAPLPGPEAWALETWYNTVGARAPDESFGALIVRVAEAALGRPYADPPATDGAEVVNLNVDAFECVSFVESSLAMARCIWQNTPTATCFSKEIVAIRYRDGRIDGFPSRLHYFEDWLGDNARRGHMTLMANQLGGEPMMRHTAYMTDHAGLFPALRDADVFRRILAMEHHLSAQPQVIVMREMVGAIEPRLLDGDIIAVTTRRSNILVRHAGLVQLGPDRTVHLLHASSAHHKVTRTKESLAEYINRRPEREGIMVARPLSPRVKSEEASAKATH